MTALIGWPFPEPPLTYGYEDGIAWATRPGPYQASINGYAQVPAEHPWADVDDMEALDVEVHGGLTYGPGDTAGRSGWIGFDTFHWRDYWSGNELRAAGLDPDPDHLALMDELYLSGSPELRPPRMTLTLSYVEEQARGLAAQIAAAGGCWDIDEVLR